LGKGHVYPQSLLRPEPFGDDRPHDAVGGGNFQPGKQERQGMGTFQFPEDLSFACACHFHVMHQFRARLPEPVQGADGDREKANEGNHDDFRKHPEAEPDDEQRGKHDQRNILRNDQKRIKAFPQQRDEVKRRRRPRPGQTTDKKAEEGQADRGRQMPGVLPPAEDPFPEDCGRGRKKPGGHGKYPHRPFPKEQRQNKDENGRPALPDPFLQRYFAVNSSIDAPPGL